MVIEAEIVVPLETRDPHLMECGIEHWNEERGEVTMEMKVYYINVPLFQPQNKNR